MQKVQVKLCQPKGTKRAFSKFYTFLVIFVVRYHSNMFNWNLADNHVILKKCV